MEYELFQSFCDALPLGVCLVDREGKIVYWNAAAEAITGYHRHDVLGRVYRGDLLGVPPEPSPQQVNNGGAGEQARAGLDGAECPVHTVLREGRAISADLFLRHKDGHRTAVHVNAFPLRDDEGELRGVAEVLDGSQGKQELASRASLTDRECELPLGLPALTDSREHLQIMLESQAAASAALFLIELAEHHAFLQHGGVAMLRQAIRILARTIAGLTPSHSWMGCWTQDRLVLLVPECPLEALEELKEKLARVGSSCALKWWGDRLPIQTRTTACYLDPSRSVDDLIEAMERELSPQRPTEVPGTPVVGVLGLNNRPSGDPLTSANEKE